jgi:outer membrane protein TolC
VLATLASGLGCSRAYYRREADCESYDLIGRGADCPEWQLDDYAISPAPESRMAPVGLADCPPMPPDDPTALRLLQCTEGKRGWRTWAAYGQTPYVENPTWATFLPRNDQGQVLLDRETVIQLARLQSPDYQSELENLYLSALDVTFERFRFDSQFFGGYSTFFTADGPARSSGRQSQLAINSDIARILEWRRRLAGGGELVVGLANSLVWQFAGPDEYTATSLLDFSLVQPLLRAAGRAVVLEELTQSQRNLLANIRQMVRYRRAFYADVMTGRSTGPGPSPGGLSLGALTTGPTSGNGGLLSLMAQQVRIRNQRANVAGLRDSLEQLQELYEAGRIDSLQLAQTRQALYDAQSRLLSLQTQYEDGLDQYKIQLGLPPGLEVTVDDPLLRPFDLIDPDMTEAQDFVAEALVRANEPEAIAPERITAAIERARRESLEAIGLVEQDMARLREELPQRRKNLERLANRPELLQGEIERTAVDVALLQRRVERLEEEYARLVPLIEQALETLATFDPQSMPTGEAPSPAAPTPDRPEVPDPAESADAAPGVPEGLIPALRQLSRHMAALSLVQARARLDTVSLVSVDLDWQRALQIARRNRLDWMNARSALVDRWRQIEIVANDLRGQLDVTFSGDMGTTDDNPVQFRSTTGRLRVGLEFDAPLTRLVERNAYREALIDYQRARREYYTFEDRVSQSLRSTLRQIALNQLDFEIQREAVQIAISQVELTQLRLQRPPRPGEGSDFGATTARDLVQALSGLLNAQNQFLNVWVDYQVRRLDLDLDLGTMRLDERGVWINPGEIIDDASGDPSTEADPTDIEGWLPPEAAEAIPTPPGAPVE